VRIDVKISSSSRVEEDQKMFMSKRGLVSKSRG